MKLALNGRDCRGSRVFSNMSARIHRLGTIYSRVDGLIRKGHLDPHDRPIWFDVYKAFPPKYEPTHKRKAPEMEVNEILYKEDALRAKIHKRLHDRLEVINLISGKELLSERWLKTCQEYISQGLSEEEALEKLKATYGLREAGEKDGQEKLLDLFL